MNQFSMANNITLTRAELAEIGDKIAENKMLKGTIETHNTTIATLNKENKELRKQLKNLQEENKAKEQDMKKKFMELHQEQKKVNNELVKYEAVPEFKDILDLYGKLLEFRNKTNNVLENSLISQEKRKMDKKIEDYKTSNMELERTLKANGAKVTAKIRGNELQQAEIELRTANEKSQQRYIANKMKIEDMKSKMKSSTTKLVGTITNVLKEIQTHLDKYEIELEKIKQSCKEFPEKSFYEKMMNVLLEQQNALMKDMLQSGISSSSTFAKEDTESIFDSDCDSLDEDDVKSVQGGNKCYRIVMHNVNEEESDGLPDIQKAKAIIKTFTTLSTDNIQVERIGQPNTTKKRPMKVLVPTYQHVQVLLKTKQKLQATCYADIKITSYKKKGPATKVPQKKNFKKV